MDIEVLEPGKSFKVTSMPLLRLFIILWLAMAPPTMAFADAIVQGNGSCSEQQPGAHAKHCCCSAGKHHCHSGSECKSGCAARGVTPSMPGGVVSAVARHAVSVPLDMAVDSIPAEPVFPPYKPPV